MTLVRSLLDGNEQNFIRAFQDFLDNTPSFLHSGVQDPFFPAFFAGAFITAFDCGIANGERIFFRFDIDPNNGQQRSLKIAVLSNPENNQQRFVRCYTITGREDIPGSRFSEEERASVQNLIGNNVQGLVWQERKVFLRRELVAYGSSRLRSHWQGFPDEDMFAVDAASPCPINGFNEIQWNGVLDERLADFPNLANDDALEVQDLIRVLLEYKVEMYNQYRQALNFGHNGKSYYHGFLLGFLMNFRYTNHQVRVYQELFMGEGYSDIALLVRGQNNITNSVPVIIELGIGGGANVALETARTRINRCPISSLSLHTTSQHAVCVGLNFNAEPSFITNVEPFLQEEQSLVEILSQTIPGAGNFEQDVAQNISNHLRFLSFGVPALQSQFLNEGNRRFNYIVNFISGGAIFAQQDIVAAGNQINIIKYLPQYQGDINDIVSSIVLNTHFEGENGAIVFHIRNVLDYNMLPGLCLQLDALQLQPQDRVCEVMCQLNPTIEVNDLPRVDDPNQVNFRVISVEAFNYGEYLQRYNNHFFPCNLLPVNDIGNLHNIAGRMMNDNWTNIVAYG